MYKYVIKPILFLLDPERVHNWAVSFGEFLGKFSGTRFITRLFYGYSKTDISKTVDGIRYKTPILLAAGFDYNARLTQILPSVGFGGVEVGSVTARSCDGNTPPRLVRLKKSKSILVRKGLRNEGIDAVIARLKSRARLPDFVIGVSIARTNSKESSGTEEGIEDYLESFKKLESADVTDYYTINISCPNSFGGETYTNPELLLKLLGVLSKIRTIKPVYIKMPINLPWQEFKDLLDIIQKFEFVKGVIIGNLNKNHDDLTHKNEVPKELKGGISGLPCKKISNELIKKTREYVGDGMTIIGCGGVMTPHDMMEKLNAGADLVQLITGLIYTGPSLVKKSCQEIARS